MKAVFIANNFVTLTRTSPDTDWQDVIPAIRQFWKTISKNKLVIDEEKLPQQPKRSVMVV